MISPRCKFGIDLAIDFFSSRGQVIIESDEFSMQLFALEFVLHK